MTRELNVVGLLREIVSSYVSFDPVDIRVFSCSSDDVCGFRTFCCYVVVVYLKCIQPCIQIVSKSLFFLNSFLNI